MKRNLQNLALYKQTCRKVIERAENRCEVMIDKDGKACNNNPKTRCGKYISTDEAKFINFLHTATRNAKSDEWVLDPQNIIYGCAEHHIEEENEGIGRVQSIDYSNQDELTYVPELE